MTQEKTTEDKLKDEIENNIDFIDKVIVQDEDRELEILSECGYLIRNKAQLKGFQDGYKEGICKSTYPLAFEKGKKEEHDKWLEIINFVFHIFDEMELQYQGEEHASIPIHLSDLKCYRQDILSKLKGEPNDN